MTRAKGKDYGNDKGLFEEKGFDIRYSGFVKAGTGAGTGMTMAQARFSESPIPNPQSPAPQEPKMSSIDFTSFLKLMAHQKASDLFITAGMPPSHKVNGKISPITPNPPPPQTDPNTSE